MRPEGVPRIFYKLDECDEESPGVRAVHDEALEEHSCDLFLHDFLRSFGEELEKDAGKVVRVVVREAELVGDGVEKEVAPLGVQLEGEALINVHARRRGRLAFGAVCMYGLNSHHKDERIDERHVVARPRLERFRLRKQQAQTQIRTKVGRLPRLEVLQHFSVERLAAERSVRIGSDARALRNLRQEIHLQIWCEGVGQAHVARKGAENQVAHLDARWRDCVAEVEMVVAEKLGKVVQQHQQHTQYALVQKPDRFVQLCVAEVRFHESHDRGEQSLQQRPSLLAVIHQEARHEALVCNELKPSKGKARDSQRLNR
mmetsp:Transcript_25110/g.82321  ORF Transcript_25110/g.82321 Transcript_25110/m.82321 type:complete len:315 (-) Transcript_25110:2287-3231(-)